MIARDDFCDQAEAGLPAETRSAKTGEVGDGRADTSRYSEEAATSARSSLGVIVSPELIEIGLIAAQMQRLLDRQLELFDRICPEALPPDGPALAQAARRGAASIGDDESTQAGEDGRAAGGATASRDGG